MHRCRRCSSPRRAARPGAARGAARGAPGRGRARGRASTPRPRSRRCRPRTADPGRRRRARRLRAPAVSSTIRLGLVDRDAPARPARAASARRARRGPSRPRARAAARPRRPPRTRPAAGRGRSTSCWAAIRAARPRVVRVLAPDERRVVERAHSSIRLCRGAACPRALPPSQAFTVAPTSANSPSWIRAARVPALRVGEQQRVLARVVGRRRRRVAAVVGGEDQQVAGAQRVEQVGQPAVEVLQAAVEVDRVVAVAPEHVGLDEVHEDEALVDRRSSSSVRWIPSTFDFVGCDSSMSRPAKMSWILPTP